MIPSQGMVSSVGSAAVASFGIPSAMPPSSPSRTNPPQGLSNPPLTPTGTVVGAIKKQQPKKLEEIAPSNPEVAQLRKQCLEHHNKKMEGLKDVFKEYLIELFFLQHLQGNMMDYLAFKKKPCVPLFTYLRQNDLDLEEEEEEEQSEVINDEVKVVTGKDGQAGTPVAIATQLPPNVSAAFSAQQQQQFQGHQGTSATSITKPVDIEVMKRQQALAQADQAKRPRIDVGRHGMIFQHPGVAPLGSPGVPLQQLMPTAQGRIATTRQFCVLFDAAGSISTLYRIRQNAGGFFQVFFFLFFTTNGGYAPRRASTSSSRREAATSPGLGSECMSSDCPRSVQKGDSGERRNSSQKRRRRSSFFKRDEAHVFRIFSPPIFCFTDHPLHPLRLILAFSHLLCLDGLSRDVSVSRRRAHTIRTSGRGKSPGKRALSDGGGTFAGSSAHFFVLVPAPIFMLTSPHFRLSSLLVAPPLSFQPMTLCGPRTLDASHPPFCRPAGRSCGVVLCSSFIFCWFISPPRHGPSPSHSSPF
ncbi:hypothetical protein ANANG_G00191070 [Anguilla anguilla]|uniref:E1A-binding protein p400 N-terminal domain-containing protein n=1 Tax=Anguilla anguilla TaxID=7936 RepID=A0A9D3RRJ6_ANGAN|nr:hypothetical protein ANANG_G00191070 [Anguilla anguilla]